MAFAKDCVLTRQGVARRRGPRRSYEQTPPLVSSGERLTATQRSPGTLGEGGNNYEIRSGVGGLQTVTGTGQGRTDTTAFTWRSLAANQVFSVRLKAALRIPLYGRASASGWVKHTLGSNRNVRTGLEYYNEAGQVIGVAFGPMHAIPSGVWTLAWAGALPDPPTGTAAAVPVYEMTSGAGAEEWFYWDDLGMLTEQDAITQPVRRVWGVGFNPGIKDGLGGMIMSVGTHDTIVNPALTRLLGRRASDGLWVDLGAGLETDIMTYSWGMNFMRHDRWTALGSELISAALDNADDGCPKWGGATKPPISSSSSGNGTVSVASTTTRTVSMATGAPLFSKSLEAGMYVRFWSATNNVNRRYFRITKVNSDNSFEVDVPPGVVLTSVNYWAGPVGRVSAPAGIFYDPMNADTGPWPNAKVFGAHRGRLFAAHTYEYAGAGTGQPTRHPHRIRWSAQTNEAANGMFQGIDDWRAGGYADIYPGQGGSKIVGLASFGTQLVILKDGGVFSMRGSVDTTGNPERSSAQLDIVSLTVGAVGPNAWDVCPAGVVFAGKDGVYLYDGSQLRSLTHGRIGRLFEEQAVNPTRGLEPWSVECTVSVVGDRVFVRWPGAFGGVSWTHLEYNWALDRWEGVTTLHAPTYRVGVGTPTPEARLHRVGAREGAARLEDDGRVRFIDVAGDFIYDKIVNAELEDAVTGSGLLAQQVIATHPVSFDMGGATQGRATHVIARVGADEAVDIGNAEVADIVLYHGDDVWAKNVHTQAGGALLQDLDPNAQPVEIGKRVRANRTNAMAVWLSLYNTLKQADVYEVMVRWASVGRRN